MTRAVLVALLCVAGTATFQNSVKFAAVART
jgi:hypothetical protein